MKRILTIAALLLVSVLVLSSGNLMGAVLLPNPGPITVEKTDSSITLSWPPVEGATSYGVWKQAIDGSYGLQWTLQEYVTEPTVTFDGLIPGAQISAMLTTDHQGSITGGGTMVLERTLMLPRWYAALPSTFQRDGIYQADLSFDGVPTPVLTLVEVPVGMFLKPRQNGTVTRTLLWDGTSETDVYVSLHIESELGSADIQQLISPSAALPLVPPQAPKRLLASISGSTISTTINFLPYRSSVKLYVKKPGTTFYLSAGGMLPSGQGYSLAYTPSASGTYSFQVIAKSSSYGSPTYSNVVELVVP